jgi:hypothetical protein
LIPLAFGSLVAFDRFLLHDLAPVLRKAAFIGYVPPECFQKRVEKVASERGFFCR